MTDGGLRLDVRQPPKKTTSSQAGGLNQAEPPSPEEEEEEEVAEIMEPQMERNSTEFIFIFTFLTVVLGPSGWDGHLSLSAWIQRTTSV